MMLSCDVVQDLIPLLIDGVASEKTARCVQAHIQTCDTCSAYYHELYVPDRKEEQQKMMLVLRKRMMKKEFSLLALGVLVVTYLMNNGILLFMNVLVLPILGFISYYILRRQWYMSLVGVTLFMIVYTCISPLLIPEADSSQIFFIVPALVLTLLGNGIGALSFYAFAKDEQYHKERMDR